VTQVTTTAAAMAPGTTAVGITDRVALTD
jgi:hypothetical protein